jgi:serine/threonine-protein kinase mTOR
VEKRGGIRVMREIIKCPSASADQKALQFANALSLALSSSTDFQLLELIADALGYMARYAPVSHQESVEMELTRALDWLRGSTPHRRLAACAVLHQLAENAPTIFFVRCKEFFDRIWGPLRGVVSVISADTAHAHSVCALLLCMLAAQM